MLPFVPKLVIFDLDGTLVEFPKEYLFTQTQRVISELSHPPVEVALLEEHFSLFDYFGFVAPEMLESFTEHFWRSFEWANYPKPIPYPGAVEVLAEIDSRGIRSAIATARVNTSEELRRELAETGFAEYISAFAGRNSHQEHWTDKQFQIGEVCSAVGILPSEAIMVGDIPPDIITAKESGVGATVAVLSGGIREEVLLASGADLVLPGITALTAHLGF